MATKPRKKPITKKTLREINEAYCKIIGFLLERMTRLEDKVRRLDERTIGTALIGGPMAGAPSLEATILDDVLKDRR